MDQNPEYDDGPFTDEEREALRAELLAMLEDDGMAIDDDPPGAQP